MTAYSSTHLKMTSEEMTTENCELVIKCQGGQVIHAICQPRAVGNEFSMRAPVPLYHCHMCCLLLVNHYVCYVVQCNTPDPFTPNMIISIEPWFLQARVAAEAPRLYFELHCMGADVYIPGH